MKTKMLLIALIALAGCAATSMGIRHNSIVDGNSISYVAVRGTAPTVVFEAGLGDGLESWTGVYEATSEFASVFAYSRPGYSPGFQKPSLGLDPRTADESAMLLRALLEQTDLEAPYVLVGHSFGGLYILEFARDYPDLVAGLVLVDARLPDFTERCEAAGVTPCRPPKSAQLLAPAHIRAELRGIDESEMFAPDPEDLGDIPVILLAATEPPPGASEEGQPVWLAVQREFSEKLADGRLIVVEGSGHYVHKDAPDFVVGAIREIVAIGSNQ